MAESNIETNNIPTHAAAEEGDNVTDGAAQPQLAAQWARVRGLLHREVGEVEYRTWLSR